MGMLTRILWIWKADLHGIMDQIEDKGLLLKQYLREMEESLREKENHGRALVNSCRQLQRDRDHRRAEMDKLGQDIDLAVSKSKDDIARMLIRKCACLKSTCIQLQQQQVFLTEEHHSLQALVGQQRLQYDQLKIKADAFFRHQQMNIYDETADVQSSIGDYHFPTEDEIELALLQRKEALAQGGAA